MKKNNHFVLCLFLWAAAVKAEPGPAPNTVPQADLKPELRTPVANVTNAGQANLVKQAAGVVAGTILGTGVCVVRKPLDEDKYGREEISQCRAKSSPAYYRRTIPCAILYAPCALIAGLIEAPFFAFDNAIVNHARPFRKAQFSLTEKEASDKQLDEDIRGQSER